MSDPSGYTSAHDELVAARRRAAELEAGIARGTASTPDKRGELARTNARIRELEGQLFASRRHA